MAAEISRFWKKFRKIANEQNVVLFDHKPGKPWESNRHVGERPRKFAHYVYHIYKDHADVSLEIHARKGDADETARIYNLIRKQKSAIEATFGEKLEWSPSMKGDVARIRHWLDGGYGDEARWDEISHELIAGMRRLESAFKIAVDSVPFPVQEPVQRRRLAA